MGAKIKYVILGLLFIGIGYFVGYFQGIDRGYTDHILDQKQKSITELKTELREREKESVLSLLIANSEVKRVDEGGLFNTKYVNYLHGQIINNATVATVRDVKLQIDFFSKTAAKVGTTELTFYEFILPYREYKFKEKIKWPNDAASYTYKIIDAKVD